MVCDAVQNKLPKPTGGNSGTKPCCIATPLGFFIGDNMKRIPLTQGKYTLVDDEDFELLSQWSWCFQPSGNTGYAIRCTKEHKKNITIRMHRQILRLKKGDGIQIDHVNHNGLDNRKGNLRKCRQAQNSQNQVMHTKGKTSKYKGVWLSRTIHKGKVYCYWYCGIRVNYKLIHLGSFRDELTAAKVYDKAAIKYFGEFACLNFPNCGRD